ncbi:MULTISPECIES: winged helix-turn-helix domain-containing protein [Vibrio]|uniref:winged helix-turn-helix domain-containing protein n=1 Tax=Vibrio TaxID=662 RepID=UPI0020755867|nr:MULTISPECIES: winged helix-turn-helix domain-containing protein [Vibrio]USD31367.1 winged helix-turn-helix domain-containing protein [Vibrio sp. SCSIO 43186]USD44412.1 winged helix-turn-helix domain-containing protein [Vibrio sp. SCSIO 43145]USD68490.1 winged helix-turn-helix domain-containing protein [Vibrio sp. SCSIO 43139]USD96177.1 transcriptional regulator [Vibrio coralliilyticus]
MLIINNNHILNLLAGSVEDAESGQKTMLGGNEVALLQYMIEHPHKPLSKSELLEQVWHKKGVIVEESSLLHCVSSCRKALQDRNSEIISTIRGVGYQFNGDVRDYEPEENSDESAQSTSLNVSGEADVASSVLRKQNARYLVVFSLSALVGYLLISAIRSPWVEAEYIETRYLGCTVQTDEPITLANVRAFQTGNQVILVDQDGTSVSYLPEEVEVVCE